MMFGWRWLDPVMGIVGAVVVAVWARGLLRDTSRILLDAEMDHPVTTKVSACLEDSGVGDHVEDLHVWRIGKSSFACMVTLSRAEASDAVALQARLQALPAIVHVTVSIGGGSPVHSSGPAPEHSHGGH
jgi:Co/Zn/Cd efflux system component